MPASRAASTTDVVPAASMRQPKLLQPIPTRETLRDPSFRCSMSLHCIKQMRPEASGIERGPKPASRALLMGCDRSESLSRREDTVSGDFAAGGYFEQLQEGFVVVFIQIEEYGSLIR